MKLWSFLYKRQDVLLYWHQIFSTAKIWIHTHRQQKSFCVNIIFNLISIYSISSFFFVKALCYIKQNLILLLQITVKNIGAIAILTAVKLLSTKPILGPRWLSTWRAICESKDNKTESLSLNSNINHTYVCCLHFIYPFFPASKKFKRTS